MKTIKTIINEYLNYKIAMPIWAFCLTIGLAVNALLLFIFLML